MNKQAIFPFSESHIRDIILNFAEKLRLNRALDVFTTPSGTHAIFFNFRVCLFLTILREGLAPIKDIGKVFSGCSLMPLS
jgi:hypothetical protein